MRLDATRLLEAIALVFGSMVLTGLIWGMFYELARLSDEESLMRQFGWILMGAVAFSVYAPMLLGVSKAAEPADVGATVIFGLTFPIWGLLCIVVPVLGWIGVVQAAITGWWFSRIVRSTALTWTPIIALTGAWLVPFLVAEFEYVGGLASVGIWNVIMAGAMATWAYRTRHHLPEHTPTCESCGYIVAGIDASHCPECGQWQWGRRCRHCGRDNRGLKTPRCPDCGRPSRQRRRRRTKPGCCPQCGYDLHGVKERRCPECGAHF